MKLDALLGRFAAAGEALPEADVRALLTQLPADAPGDWRQLAAALALRERNRTGTDVRVIGISGGQGAGKSTLAALLVAASEALGRPAVSLSLDDFYLTLEERQALEQGVHPLLQTRGVPGTHDVALANRVLDALTAGQRVEVPVFDKSVDDRRPVGREVVGPLALVVFEGWCVGAPPEPAARLATPVNDLERARDADGAWRGSVNEALAGPYGFLWARLDALLYLKVPDLEAVVRWRTQQEAAHPVARRMSATQIRDFVAHYERLTRWMAERLPDRADLVGFLDENHDLADFLVR